jgi:SAM-dependent methyltransferase
MAQQVGATGQVIATDVDTTYLERFNVPNLGIHRHNILNDSLDQLGPGSFDLVCARLLLFWLAGKQEQAVSRMVECLKPGGWLTDEDGDWGLVSPVDPSHPHYSLYHRVWKNGDWWTARGYDPTFGRTLPVLFERCGLGNIQHEASASVVRGGSPWAQWWVQSLEGIRSPSKRMGT